MNEERKKKLIKADAMIIASRNLLLEIYDEEDKYINFTPDEMITVEIYENSSELINTLYEIMALLEECETNIEELNN